MNNTTTTPTITTIFSTTTHREDCIWPEKKCPTDYFLPKAKGGVKNFYVLLDVEKQIAHSYCHYNFEYVSGSLKSTCDPVTKNWTSDGAIVCKADELNNKWRLCILISCCVLVISTFVLCIDFIQRRITKVKLRRDRERLAKLARVRGVDDRIRPFPALRSDFVMEHTQHIENDREYYGEGIQGSRGQSMAQKVEPTHKRGNLFTILHPKIRIL